MFQVGEKVRQHNKDADAFNGVGTVIKVHEMTVHGRLIDVRFERTNRINGITRCKTWAIHRVEEK